jgi:hypothetical protein
VRDGHLVPVNIGGDDGERRLARTLPGAQLISRYNATLCVNWGPTWTPIERQTPRRITVRVSSTRLGAQVESRKADNGGDGALAVSRQTILLRGECPPGCHPQDRRSRL